MVLFYYYIVNACANALELIVKVKYKNKYIAYKGEVFELKDSQKRALLRELDNLFTKFEKSKVEDKSSKPKTYKHGNPHINRAGLASSAGSLAARRNIK